MHFRIEPAKEMAGCKIGRDSIQTIFRGKRILNWKYFDKFYCISLEERPDRRAESNAEFEKAGLSELVEYLIRKKHPMDPERGIYESHLTCIEKGLNEGADTIVVFEDDILFHGMDSRVLQNAIDFLESTPDWHILFLGCMVQKSRRTANPSVLEIRYRSLSHAYAIHRRLAETLGPWRGVPYDDMLRDLENNRAYALFPSFAFQSNSPSDNERYLPLDRFRRFFGGLRPLQQLDEFYHLHRRRIIAIHLAAIGMLLWFYK